MNNINNNEIIPDCKVIMLGDSGVGKSSIISRYVSGYFVKDLVSTTGTNYSYKICENKDQKVRLNIWDTAGQEKYRSLGKHFYKNAYIICIVFDITKKETFQSIKEVWYPEILKNGEEHHIIAVIGNKIDKYTEEEVNEDECSSYAKEIDGHFFLVSAKNGKGINDMFQTLADIYLEPSFKKKMDETINEYQRKDSHKLNKNNCKENKDNKLSKCC
jgi:small GTP-binding protein